MRVAFLHPRCPAQFEAVIRHLLDRGGVDVDFVCEQVIRPLPPGVRQIPYAPDGKVSDRSYWFSRPFEQPARATLGARRAIQEAGLRPDVIVAHASFLGTSMLRADFPHARRLGFFEIFYDARVTAGRREFPLSDDQRTRVPAMNAWQLMELDACDRGWCPSSFQRSTYPAAYHSKLAVLPDPIDTDLFSPGPPRGALPALALPPGVPIVSYVSRGLEAYRGFDHFMEIARRVSSRHPSVHFAVCGAEQTFYGNELSHLRARSFKAHVLERVQVDPSRVHFLGHVSEDAVADLFRVTSAHVHWTVAHTLSWSPLQALSAGALVIASDSEPVRDAIQDGVNGLLFPPEDLDAAADRVLQALRDPEGTSAMRARAREGILARHAPAAACPRIADFILQGG